MSQTTNKNSEYLFELEGCYITELLNSPDDPEVSIARARVPAGVTTAWHRLADTRERYLILSGTGSVEVGTQAPQKVSAGHIVNIKPMERQRITNTGGGNTSSLLE